MGNLAWYFRYLGISFENLYFQGCLPTFTFTELDLATVVLIEFNVLRILTWSIETPTSKMFPGMTKSICLAIGVSVWLRQMIDFHKREWPVARGEWLEWTWNINVHWTVHLWINECRRCKTCNDEDNKSCCLYNWHYKMTFNVVAMK